MIACGPSEPEAEEQTVLRMPVHPSQAICISHAVREPVAPSAETRAPARLTATVAGRSSAGREVGEGGEGWRMVGRRGRRRRKQDRPSAAYICPWSMCAWISWLGAAMVMTDMGPPIDDSETPPLGIEVTWARPFGR
jgi:hypothetical protein